MPRPSEWFSRADLLRVKGIHTQFSDLREAMEKATPKLNKVTQMPGLSNVKAWIANAKKLKRAVEY